MRAAHRRFAVDASIYAGYVVVGVVFLASALWVIPLSLQPMNELFAFPPTLLPQHPTIAAYQDVLATSLVAKGFFDTIPTALDDAARIDGCSRLQAMRRVLLPVMLPGLASTAILLAIGTWGQFLVLFVLLSKSDRFPINVGIPEFQSSTDTVSTRLLAAAAVLSVLPIVVIIVVLQRFIIGAMAAGAVKE